MARRRGVFKILLVLALGWLVLNNLSQVKAGGSELALAAAMYFVCLLPLLIYFVRREENIPYLPIMGIYYFVFFGLPIFNNYNWFILQGIDPVTTTRCLGLALWGFVSLLIAFYTPLGGIVNLMVIPLKMPWDHRRAYRMAIFLGLAGIALQYVTSGRNIPVGLTGPVTFIKELSIFSILILFMLQLQNKLKFRGKAFLWLGLFLPRMLLDLITGMTAGIAMHMTAIFFVYLYYRHRLPLFRIALAGLAFFVIFSARNSYRGLTAFRGPQEEYSPIEDVNLYLKLIFDKIKGEKEQHRETYEAIASRTDNLIIFAKVVEATPKYVPYWDGYTYSTLLSSVIPRLIYPDKPKKVLGQEFGHRYSLLHYTDTKTSIGLPFLTEMYVNFGPLAVIAGMFILGLVYRALYAILNHPQAGEGGFVIAVMIFKQFLNIDSYFALIAGSVLQYILLFYIIARRMQAPVGRIGEIK